MEQLVAIMLMIGCADDYSVCRTIPHSNQEYASAEMCNTALKKKVFNASENVPLVLGKCVTVDVGRISGKSEISWAVSWQGDLLARIDYGNGEKNRSKLALNVAAESGS